MSKKNNLSWRIRRVGSTVEFQVLDMPEEWRGKGQLGWTPGGVTLHSVCFPQLCRTEIYLCGKNNRSDHTIAALLFDSNTEADRYMRNVQAGLRARKAGKKVVAAKLPKLTKWEKD